MRTMPSPLSRQIAPNWAMQKFQGKEKFVAALDTDEKTRASLEKDIQNKIKDMRMGKKVVDDEDLIAVEAEVEEEAADAIAEAGELIE